MARDTLGNMILHLPKRPIVNVWMGIWDSFGARVTWPVSRALEARSDNNSSWSNFPPRIAQLLLKGISSTTWTKVKLANARVNWMLQSAHEKVRFTLEMRRASKKLEWTQSKSSTYVDEQNQQKAQVTCSAADRLKGPLHCSTIRGRFSLTVYGHLENCEFHFCRRSMEIFSITQSSVGLMIEQKTRFRRRSERSDRHKKKFKKTSQMETTAKVQQWEGKRVGACYILRNFRWVEKFSSVWKFARWNWIPRGCKREFLAGFGFGNLKFLVWSYRLSSSVDPKVVPP